MFISGIAFIIFAIILLGSALMVITARNPVHSVLFLILAFFNSAGLFVLLGAEFVGMLMVIVYVGAVAVLFLFVVMMLDISFADLRKGAMQYVPLGLLLAVILLCEFIALYGAWEFAPNLGSNLSDPISVASEGTNARSIGLVVYTDYFLAFQIAGLVLFVAMIGAIVLTHRTRPGVLKQSVASQQRVNPDDVLEIRKVTTGTGI
ncbi:MAG: NADH:ubiquinone oxidoreductase subunit J [Micavibrio sp.]|nr:NADH:ubiquinone oxidoreductase subunit J [Micavibrio sp.]|tara:strand:- start:371 stop:985 length:615 start_codon:yes stop_codon:yes gene_type:complete